MLLLVLLLGVFLYYLLSGGLTHTHQGYRASFDFSMLL